MEIISAPGSKMMLSERQREGGLYGNKSIFPFSPAHQNLPSPSPLSCVSPQHEGVPEYVPTTFQPVQHSLQLSWLFLCIPLND